jgi:uridine kinase
VRRPGAVPIEVGHTHGVPDAMTATAPWPGPARMISDRLDGLGRLAGCVLLGIGGHGASGKTTLARAIAATRDDVQIVSTDAFWTGSMFDLDRLRGEVVDELLAGRTARYQAWDWAAQAPAGERTVAAAGVVIIDGVCALHRMFRDDLDLRVWVETPPAIRLARGVARDGEDSRTRWIEVWMPNEQRYVDADEPVGAADLIIDGTAAF